VIKITQNMQKTRTTLQ